MAGIGGVTPYRSYVDQTRAFNQLSTGKRINTAADDAAGMAIAKKLESQSTGASVAARNAGEMNDLLKVSDGAMSQISEGLGRIRELAVQSKNGIYSAGDRKIFQEEINGILETIDGIGKTTQFNGKNVLDGSMSDSSAAVGPNGEGKTISIPKTLTDSLGIKDFDVTGDFDLETIDKALETVDAARGSVGAQSNALGFSERAMENAYVNQEAARSRQEDSDMAKAAMDNNKNNILDQVGVAMQKMQMQGMGMQLQLLR